MKKKFPKSTLILILLLIIAVCVIAVLVAKPPQVVEVGPKIENSEDVQTLEGSINLPGYDAITFKADKKEQEVMIPNPPENTCLVKITLKLSDGTVLWESEDVEPGRYSTPIVFEKALKKGTYKDSVLEYKCFTNDKEHSQLNGAECKFTLITN